MLLVILYYIFGFILSILFHLFLVLEEKPKAINISHVTYIIGMSLFWALLTPLFLLSIGLGLLLKYIGNIEVYKLKNDTINH